MVLPSRIEKYMKMKYGTSNIESSPRSCDCREVAKRGYRQYCATAQALDLVGERWTLLIVRELVVGPRRFSDLLEALTGIGPNLLSQRLKALEAAGVIARDVLPPPGASRVYHLTPLGRELEPVVFALARFGLRLLGPPQEGDVFRPASLLLALRVTFDADAAPGLAATYELRVDGDTLWVRVADGAVETGAGHAPAGSEEPVVRMETDGATLLEIAGGVCSPRDARAEGRVTVRGRTADYDRFFRLFTLPAPLPPD